jgi:putative flippase GtrA
MVLSAALRAELGLAARFAAVCMVGFAFDAAGLRLGVLAGLVPAAARLISLIVSLQVTFALSRWLVFHVLGRGGVAGQWARYMLANGFGVLCNLWIFVSLVGLRWPAGLAIWAPLMLSSGAAFVTNYAGTRLFVFGRGLAAAQTKAAPAPPSGGGLP